LHNIAVFLHILLSEQCCNMMILNAFYGQTAVILSTNNARISTNIWKSSLWLFKAFKIITTTIIINIIFINNMVEWLYLYAKYVHFKNRVILQQCLYILAMLVVKWHANTICLYIILFIIYYLLFIIYYYLL